MLILGFSGGPEQICGVSHFAVEAFHDSAAVMIHNGEVVAAIEEERINRVKHTNKLPVNAIRGCLDAAGVKFSEVDRVAWYMTENDDFWRRQSAKNPTVLPIPRIRELLHFRFKEQLDDDIRDDRLAFVHHHRAHAISAYLPSGFSSSLVMTIDGVGDGLCSTILSAQGMQLTELRNIPQEQSLGGFYSMVCERLGFGSFEEYKVMGLAPYGDPGVYRSTFDELCQLGDSGQYTVHNNNVKIISQRCSPRRKGDPILQAHKDLAAALQEMLERVIMHVLRHYRAETGHRKLCIAGGVGQNCSLNGKILSSGLFDDVFIQPAAYDAGCALGAALEVYRENMSTASRVPVLKHVYWGRHIGSNEEIHRELTKWQGFVTFERTDRRWEEAAQRLAAGEIIGWAQGRSEFGPRALGNRSILADPRPAENKEIVNAMVKKREAFRPFAPAVMEEHVHEFFDVASSKNFPFMTFVANVRKDKQKVLGAVTHVDGTARLQTVSRENNPCFWKLIEAFRDITGIPVVLNTSFNNNAEPIVDSIYDAIVCFITTGLHRLVIGDYVISKGPKTLAHDLSSLVPELPIYAQLRCLDRWVSYTKKSRIFQLGPMNHSQPFVEISDAAYDVLANADGKKTVGAIAKVDDRTGAALMDELWDLWVARLIKLSPAE